MKSSTNILPAEDHGVLRSNWFLIFTVLVVIELIENIIESLSSRSFIQILFHGHKRHFNLSFIKWNWKVLFCNLKFRSEDSSCNCAEHFPIENKLPVQMVKPAQPSQPLSLQPSINIEDWRWWWGLKDIWILWWREKPRLMTPLTLNLRCPLTGESVTAVRDIIISLTQCQGPTLITSHQQLEWWRQTVLLVLGTRKYFACQAGHLDSDRQERVWDGASSSHNSRERDQLWPALLTLQGTSCSTISTLRTSSILARYKKLDRILLF